MSLKEIIFSMMNEALENMDEAVEVRHDRYMRSHGKKASGGSGSWMFTHKDKGDVNVNDKEEVHTAQGSFSDAKKSAQQWGKQHGHSSVYVMEEVDLSEAIQGVPDARLKFHALKDVPHGSYTKKQISAEHDRCKKTMGAEYASVKPALSEEVELDEKLEFIDSRSQKTGETHTDVYHNGTHMGTISKHYTRSNPNGSHRIQYNSNRIPQGSKGYHAHEGLPSHDAAKKLVSKHFNEEVEQIDELSSNTLNSYINKAAKERGQQGIRAGASGYKSPDQKDAIRTMSKRLSGISAAAGRLAGKANKNEEVEELSEISRDLARSYIKKAAASKLTGEPVKKDRDSGIALAGKKAYPGLVGKAKIDAKEDKDQE